LRKKGDKKMEEKIILRVPIWKRICAFLIDLIVLALLGGAYWIYVSTNRFL